MGLFSRNKAKKERALMDALWNKLDGRELHYVVRRFIKDDGSPAEQVLGKGGRIMAPGDFVSVYAGGTEIFHNDNPATVSCGELMALNGVLIEGFNTLTNQDDRLVAYYSYYRK